MTEAKASLIEVCGQESILVALCSQTVALLHSKIHSKKTQESLVKARNEIGVFRQASLVAELEQAESDWHGYNRDLAKMVVVAEQLLPESVLQKRDADVYCIEPVAFYFNVCLRTSDCRLI